MNSKTGKKPNVKLSLKPIPPTLRGKKRYILLELLPAAGSALPALDERSFERAVSDTLLGLFGALGYAKRRVSLVKCIPAKNRAIVRCANEYCEEAKGALLFLREVSGTAVIPKILKVSGAIGKLK